MDAKEMYSIIKNHFQAAANQTIADDGDLGIRMQIVAGEIASLYNHAQICSKQILPQTASGEFLAHHAATRNIIKKISANASGTVSFKRSSPASQDITIPIGTVCTSSAGNSIMYITTSEAILQAGTTSVLAPVQASVIGKTGNIDSLKIDVLVSAISGIDSVSNPEPIGGGMEQETDESLRKRLLASYLNPPNGANLKFYEQVALTASTVWSANAVISSSTPNEIFLYITNLFRNTSDSLCAEVQGLVELAREVGMKVTVKKPTLVPQNVSVKVLVRDLHDSVAQKLRVSQYIQDKILQLHIGESFNPYTIATDIKSEVDGFIDLAFITPTAMVKVSDSQVLSLGSVIVDIVKSW